MYFLQNGIFCFLHINKYFVDAIIDFPQINFSHRINGFNSPVDSSSSIFAQHVYHW